LRRYAQVRCTLEVIQRGAVNTPCYTGVALRIGKIAVQMKHYAKCNRSKYFTPNDNQPKNRSCTAFKAYIQPALLDLHPSTSGIF